jgi:hypothetical protein
VDWQTFWQQIWLAVAPVLATAISAIVINLLMAAKRWIDSKISSDRHLKAASICMDAVLAAMQKLGPQAAAMLADGKLSQDEKDALKNMARQIAKERLAELRGLAVERLGGWLEHQLDISLGKLEAHLLGTVPLEDGLTIGPDDVAQ